MGRKRLLKNVVEEPDNDDMEDLDLIIVPPDNPAESNDEQIGVELEENEDEADYQDDSEDQVVPVAKKANRNWSKNISLADFEPHRKMSILERLDITRLDVICLKF
uniref:Uncharacterized protein n=1 Tax=Acrobeloides nanus TaxID=290746 RepID=A0A914ELK2_9BILA